MSTGAQAHPDVSDGASRDAPSHVRSGAAGTREPRDTLLVLLRETAQPALSPLAPAGKDSGGEVSDAKNEASKQGLRGSSSARSVS